MKFEVSSHDHESENSLTVLKTINRSYFYTFWEKCQNMTHFKRKKALLFFLCGVEKDIADRIYMNLRACFPCLASSFLFYLPCCNSYTQFSLFIRIYATQRKIY